MRLNLRELQTPGVLTVNGVRARTGHFDLSCYWAGESMVRLTSHFGGRFQRPEYRASGLLPDEVSLSSSLGISRNTLRAVIDRLVAEGRLERNGRPTMIARNDFHP